MSGRLLGRKELACNKCASCGQPTKGKIYGLSLQTVALTNSIIILFVKCLICQGNLGNTLQFQQTATNTVPELHQAKQVVIMKRI